MIINLEDLYIFYKENSNLGNWKSLIKLHEMHMQENNALRSYIKKIERVLSETEDMLSDLEQKIKSEESITKE